VEVFSRIPLKSASYAGARTTADLMEQARTEQRSSFAAAAIAAERSRRRAETKRSLVSVCTILPHVAVTRRGTGSRRIFLRNLPLQRSCEVGLREDLETRHRANLESALALLGPGEMADLRPQNGPKRTLVCSLWFAFY